MDDPVFFCSHQPSAYTTHKERAVFSQWYPQDFIWTMAPVPQVDGDFWNVLRQYTFNCREQWMMAWKAAVFRDMGCLLDILAENDPRKIIKLGRTIKGFNGQIWDGYKYAIVLAGNYEQFTQNQEMRQVLQATGNRQIVEAAWYDKVWGIGLREAQAKVTPQDQWPGQNLLGKALMETREILASETGNASRQLNG